MRCVQCLPCLVAPTTSSVAERPAYPIVAQVMGHLPLSTFRRCVARYDGEHKGTSFSCLDQFYTMAFAQLTFRESLRVIEGCLATQVQAVVDEPRPCCALGFVEERKTILPVITLGLPELEDSARSWQRVPSGPSRREGPWRRDPAAGLRVPGVCAAAGGARSCGSLP